MESEKLKIKKQILSLLMLGIFLGITVVCYSSAYGQAAQSNGVVEINKRPLFDFQSLLRSRISSKGIDPDASFDVELSGSLDENGHFEKQKSKFVRSDGSAKTVELVKEGLMALGDSGFLTYLRNLGVTAIAMRAKRDASTFSLSISAPFSDDSRARTTASGLNTMISMGRIMVQKNAPQGKMLPEITLLENTSVSTESTTVNIVTALPKSVFHNLVKTLILNSKSVNEHS